jgi:hypothetical protein
MKAVWLAVVMAIISVSPVFADCRITDGPNFDSGYHIDYCYNKEGGGSEGMSVYDCGLYDVGNDENPDIKYYCYWHIYECDSPCVPPSTPPPGLIACGESAPMCGGYCASGACRAKVSEPNQ